ncbi:MAG: hypothetical protein NXI30_08705 [bacterium]|nr:hypothetical protein [bacterium]
MSTSRPLSDPTPTPRSLIAAFVLALAAVACSDAPDDTVSDERLAAYRAQIPDLVAEDCRRHETNVSVHGPACEAASSLFHEAVGDLLATVPPTWEKQVLAIGGICRAKAYRYAQSELDRREETDLLVEGLAAAPVCLEEQFELLKDVARREGVPVPGD